VAHRAARMGGGSSRGMVESGDSAGRTGDRNNYANTAVWWTYIGRSSKVEVGVDGMSCRDPIWRGGVVMALMPTFLWTAERTMDWDHWGFLLAPR
jgi:hypothetical protein